ncbi:FUN14 domain-containing protein [Candidatus Riflebacteria bacterium]
MDSTPQSARIFLNGEDKGITPKGFTSKDNILPGIYRLVLLKKGFLTFEKEIPILQGKVNIFRFNLKESNSKQTTATVTDEVKKETISPQNAEQQSKKMSLLPISGGWEAIFGLMSFGGFAGFCVGYATKKVAKIAVLVFGLLLLGVQFLASQNLLTVNWQAIEQLTKPYFAEGGFNNILNIFLGIITVNLPFAGPFVLAFWLGLKKG